MQKCKKINCFIKTAFFSAMINYSICVYFKHVYSLMNTMHS